VTNDPLLFLPERTEVLVFLRHFFDALGNRDWPSVEACFHPHASLFSSAGGGGPPSLERWETSAPRFRVWLEDRRVRRVGPRTNDLELMVTDKSAICSVPGRSRREAGARAITLTREEGGWLIRHLHLTRLGIELGD
jgi:hypothetical protein